MSLNIIANSRAYVALLAALPGLGITLAEGQTPLQALQARLSAAPAAPTAEATQAATVALLVAAGIPVAAGQAPAAAITAFLADLEQAGNDLATAQASLASVTGQLTAAQARADLFASTLAAKGVKITAKDPTKGITAADIDAAIEARISTRAGEMLAQTGTPAVVSSPGAGAGSQAKKAVATAGNEIDTVAKIYADRRAVRG